MNAYPLKEIFFAGSGSEEQGGIIPQNPIFFIYSRLIMKIEFETRAAQNAEEDIAKYKACFDNNQSPKKVEAIKWLLFNRSKLWVQFAFSKTDSEKVAAIVASLPLRMKFFEKEVQGGQFLDTMTDASYRGKGLFTICANKAYEQLHIEEGAFAWGFPNENAAHGWFNKLGWKEISPLSFLIKPLQLGYLRTKFNGFMKNLIPNIPLAFQRKVKWPSGYTLEKTTHFDERYDLLWETFSQDINIAVIRDASYLNWRYIDKPESDYKIYSVVNDQNQIECLIISCLRNKHKGRIGYVMELIFNPAKPHLALSALQMVTNEMITDGGDVILSWALPTSKTFQIYRGIGFYLLPKYLQFIKLYFGAKIIHPNIDERLYNANNWYISYSDSDTV